MSIVIGLLSLGCIVLIHELGHYCAAKYCHVVVEEFAIGIGPKIASFSWRNTTWSIRLLPLGGFCKMKNSKQPRSKSEYNLPVSKDAGTLASTSFRGKALVLLCGPLANIMLYMILSFVLYGTGLTTYDLPPTIEPISEPALRSALRLGDTIVQVQDTPIYSFSQAAEELNKHMGKPVTITYKRKNTRENIQLQLNNHSPVLGIIPYIAPIVTRKTSEMFPDLELGDVITSVNATPLSNAISLHTILNKHNAELPIVFTIERNAQVYAYEHLVSSKASRFDLFGIEVPTVPIQQWNTFSEFLAVRTRTFLDIVTSTFMFFINLIRLNTVQISENTAGPIRIISMVGGNTLSNATQHGWIFAIISLLNITSILSLAIASLNLLPIPVLDGGHLMFYTIYRLLNKEPSMGSQIRYTTIGVIILLALFGFVMISDIISLF